VTPDQIRQWNHLPDDALAAGQRLRVHTPEDAAMASAAVDSAQIAALRVPAGRHHGRHGRHAASGSASSKSHVVRKGETLGLIAQRYGVSVSDLRRANGIRGTNLRSGQRLRLPG